MAHKKPKNRNRKRKPAIPPVVRQPTKKQKQECSKAWKKEVYHGSN